MYVKVRLKLKSGEITNVRAEIPNDIRNYQKDTIDDAVSDWLDDNGVEYSWYIVDIPDIYPTNK